MKTLFLLFIRTYQKTLSLDHGLLGKAFPNTRFCRFTPSCSQYCYEAVDKYGVVKGSVIGAKRVFRCNPWVKGGFDPVK